MAVSHSTGRNPAGPRKLEDPERPASARARKDEAQLRTTLYRLHCFEVVVEEAGFKRATARLHITQPALSYQIKQLEEEFGAQLFYRRPGGVSPTEAGRLLFQHVQEISAAVRQTRHAVRQLSEGSAGEVRIGTVNSVGIYFLPQPLLAMRERYPGTHPKVLYRDSEGVVEALITNRIDLAILADPRVDRRLCYETLFEERVSLVCGRSHPFFGLKAIDPKRLQGVPLVALAPHTPTGALIKKYLERLGVAVEPVLSIENVETVKRMVQIGFGVGFLPDMVTERDVVSDANPKGRLWRIPIEPPLTRRIALVTWNEPAASRAVVAFIEEVYRHCNSSLPNGRKGKG